MVAPPPTDFLDDTYPAKDFLESGEKIAIVDDSQEILLLIETLLTKEGFTVLTACNGAELKQILERESIALALLDIGLPDCDGTDLLKEIAPLYPDMSIMMLTGTTNLQIALHCLRQGADDFLVKPVTVDGFNLAVRRVLQKRKLTIQNHRYQKQLEYTNFRTQFLHQLNLKMNNAYLNSTELNTVLQSILVGITAEEGLKFNRAFLLLFNDDRTELQGRFAIGPKFKADATQVWDGIKKDNLHLADILDKVSLSIMDNDTELNAIIQNLKIPADNENHVLIRACESRQSIHVQNGLANSEPISKHLLKCFQEENFVITPLFSPNQSLGVIIADNFVTATPITVDDINSLEIFANQASLAIEHSRSYKDMQNKIVELEEVTQELETNKDLLIETERYSALGHMSAQLVHAIRNPVTSIGGIARLLGKKNSDIKTQKFLDMMIMESSKIESTLDDLFNFVGEDKPDKCLQPLYPLIQKSILLFYGSMKKQSILYQLNLPSPAPELYIDSKRIRQMLHHLIRNGVEAMKSGGVLTITSKSLSSEVQITIEDSGDGIKREDIDHVANPFFTTKTYGTGMGLTLVEKIVEEHQGTFSLSCGKVHGMVAKITLPYKTDQI